jgi:Brp/Blh family beta-carotene 15,15'-monooxygenase
MRPLVLNFTFLVISCLVLLPFLPVFALPEQASLVLLILALVTTGIPHGAIDHVIFAANYRLAGGKNFNLGRQFFLPYLLLLGFTFLVWVLAPALMFWVFLLVSAYHFGQSQLFHVRFAEKSLVKAMLYLSWGFCWLGSFWYFHWEQQVAIIQSVFSWDLSVGGQLYELVRMTAIVSGILTLLILALCFYNRQISLWLLLQEVGLLGFLLFVNYYFNLYVAFALYFGLWHSLRVILTEYQFLRQGGQPNLRTSTFIKSFLPFSLLSFVGIGLLISVSMLLQQKVAPFMLFLIFISALTMPHAVCMFFMYKNLRPKQTGGVEHKALSA